MQDLIKSTKNTSDLLQRTLLSLTQGITGLASSDRKDLILSIGHIFQRMRSGEFLRVLINEWDTYKSKGKIKDNYEQTEQHKSCLQELLEFLDKDTPNEITFSFLKKLFLTISSETMSDGNSILPQQYLRIVRSLSSGEILVIYSNYQIAKYDNWNKAKSTLSLNEWLSLTSEKSSLKHSDLVKIFENTLIEKNLLTPTLYTDPGTVTLSKHFRLTELAFEICKFVEKYDEENAN